MTANFAGFLNGNPASLHLPGLLDFASDHRHNLITEHSAPMDYSSSRFSAFCLMVISLPIVAFGQAAESDDWRIVFSEGEADTAVAPDEIVFFLTVESSHLDIDTARREHSKKLEKLLDVAKAMKIRDRDIRMDLLELQPEHLVRGSEGTEFNPRAFSSSSDEPELQEYFARRYVVITLRDLDRYTDMLADILELDVELTRSPVYRVSNEDEVKDALTRAAIADARYRATRSVTLLDMELSDPIRIGEPDWYSAYEYSYSSYSRNYGSDRDISPTRSVMTPDLVSYSVSVSVSFQMISPESE